MTTFLDLVCGVRLVGTDEQMVRVDAERRVTSMANALNLLDIAFVSHVAEPMSQIFTLLKPNATVSLIVLGCRPDPAAAWLLLTEYFDSMFRVGRDRDDTPSWCQLSENTPLPVVTNA